MFMVTCYIEQLSLHLVSRPRDLHEQLLRSVMSFKYAFSFLRSSQVLINLVLSALFPFYSMVLYSATKWTTLSRSSVRTSP